MYGPMGYGWGGGWASGLFFGAHGLSMLLFWGLLIWGAIVLFRWIARVTPAAREDGALGVLRDRFARGELTREQFDSMREALH